MKRARRAFLAALTGALTAPSFGFAEAPLSAIDWLKAPAPISVAQPWQAPLGTQSESQGDSPPLEGDVSGSTVPIVDVMPLDAPRADAVGLLPSSTTGLPAGLWSSSRTADLIAAFAALPDTPLPAIQALYYTLLLAEADPPSDATDDTAFLRARLEALRRFGAVEPALSLVQRAGPEVPGLFDPWMDLALLTGQEDAPCAALVRDPALSESYANRVFCLARMGDWSTAALVLDIAAATGLLTPHEEQLLVLFLNPELIEELVPLAPPREMTPLIFRLYEAVGTPLPTRTLPREYAVADLRGTLGWRAELEAAERLARTGALPANRLLGLYTERRPAASGGVWDRVRAVQRFDEAMSNGTPEDIARELPQAWRAMQGEELGVAFATLYGPALARMTLPGERSLAFRIALLAPDLATTRGVAPPDPELRFWAEIAHGAPTRDSAPSPRAGVIAAGFETGSDPVAVPDAEQAKLDEGRLGEAILRAARRLDSRSVNRSSSGAIATLRRLGLEEVARRAALQLHILRGL